MFAYNPIRSYAGGYHAGTPLTCYLLSIPTIVAVLTGIKFAPWDGLLLLSVIAFSGIVIMLFAPVEDANKPLDQLERKVYKKRSRIILLVLSVLIVLLWHSGFEQSALSIVMALGVAAVMLILGAIKNSNLLKKEKA